MGVALIGCVASLILSIVLYPLYINFLESRMIKQTVSDLAVDAFKNKKKTVTFGGLIFVVVPTIMMLGYAIIQSNVWVLLVAIVYVIYGSLGFVDDYRIVKEGRNDGLSEKTRLAVEISTGVLFYVAYRLMGGEDVIGIPFTSIRLYIGLLYPVLIVFMMTGFANAVNITDGMDGLASGTSLIAFVPLAIFAAIGLHYDLLFVILVVFGSVFAFFIFNAHPARIFMGDVGSLALGSLFAMLSILLHVEILLALIGGVFVIETLSVIIQQTYYRRTKKRLFKYTPIHYSFTLSGWSEVRVVRMFWVIGAICAVLSIVIEVFL